MMSREFVCFNGEVLLECDGCEWHFSNLSLLTWHDSWCSGEDITGAYCPDCFAIHAQDMAFPNMSANYVSQCECGC